MIVPLIKGLKYTLGRFFSKPITIQYPEERREVAPRWRGIHYFNLDENGVFKCVACGLCAAVCPSKCIKIEAAEDEEGKRYPMTYEINAIRCIYCGFCVEACPVDAIRMGKKYDFTDYHREDFMLTIDRLVTQDYLDK